MKFIEGITKSQEAAIRDPLPALPHPHVNAAIVPHSHTHSRPETYTESVAKRSGSQLISTSKPVGSNATIQRNETEALRSEHRRAGQDEPEPRVLSTVRSPSADRTGNAQGQTLPVVEELGEASSLGGKSGRSRERDDHLSTPMNDEDDIRPATPKKDFSLNSSGLRMVERSSLDKDLPPLPLVESPTQMRNDESVVPCGFNP